MQSTHSTTPAAGVAGGGGIVSLASHGSLAIVHFPGNGHSFASNGSLPAFAREGQRAPQGLLIRLGGIHEPSATVLRAASAAPLSGGPQGEGETGAAGGSAAVVRRPG